MQINLNSTIYKSNTVNYKPYKESISVTKPENKFQTPVTFMGSSVVKKTVSSQIAHEKAKLLRHFKDILKLNVPKLSPEDRLIAFIRKVHATIANSIRKEDEIQREMELLVSTTRLNAQQKLNRAHELKKEYLKLGKIKVPEDKSDTPPPKDNYDYALINKFKMAVLDDNYDLAKIHKDHYKDLESISTIEEFKEKYPSIRIPKEPQEVIVDKIVNSLNRNFYYDLDELFESGDKEAIKYCLLRFFDDYFSKLAEQFNDKTNVDLLNMFKNKVAEKVLQTLQRIKEFDAFETIPTNKSNQPPILTSADKEMLGIDFNAMVIGTLKQMYLEDKKLNQIVYKEGDKTIDIASIKAPEYRFEKIPDKTKRLITEALKPAMLQRDYQNFTEEELKSRLKLYAYTDISDNEDIFNTIIDFDSCKFTGEDRQYLIKFLQILDNISDKNTSLEEASETIIKNNIRPHGTFKFNEIERKKIEEKTKQEHQKNQILTRLREDFNNMINKLYELNLADIAEKFSKYYPENYNEKSLKETQDAIKLITECINYKDTAKIRTKIFRREMHNDFLLKQPLSEEFIKAKKYANSFLDCNTEDKIGQFLINNEIIKNYPDSKNMFQKPKILDKIIEKFGYDSNLAVSYLCKYEDYLFLDAQDKQSIIKILEIFDNKNPNDRILLKNIIEDDYSKSDTTLEYIGNSYSIKSTMAAKAKAEILNKYKFPKCIDLYEAFEEAQTSIAGEYGSSGIKKTGSNNNALEYKVELKIMGYPDRLFSSNNDYYFDIYSEKGLH